jgi:hypothetical protein
MNTIDETLDATIHQTLEEPVEKPKQIRIRKTTPAKQREYYLRWREANIEKSVENTRRGNAVLKEKRRLAREAREAMKKLNKN